MKIELNVYITDQEQFLRSPDAHCITAVQGRHMDDTWLFAGEVEVEINPDTGKMIEFVTADIDRKVTELKTAIQVAENRKAELLALPAPITEADFEFEDEQSRDDIARDENRFIDSQESRTI